MSKQTRPGINPVTMRCRRTAVSGASPINIAIARLETDSQPHDGIQKMGAKNRRVPTIVMSVWDGSDTSPTLLETLVIEESKFLEAIVLLFPDKLAHTGDVLLEAARGLFSAAKPRLDGSRIEEVK